MGLQRTFYLSKKKKYDNSTLLIIDSLFLFKHLQGTNDSILYHTTNLSKNNFVLVIQTPITKSENILTYLLENVLK